MNNFMNETINSLKEEVKELNKRITITRENRDYGTYKNLIQALERVLHLISRYDYQRYYSEYTTEMDGKQQKQVAIWEQNGNGEIRNHKIWNVMN